MPAKDYAQMSQRDLSTDAVRDFVKTLMQSGFTKEMALESLAIQLHENLVEIKKFYAARVKEKK